MSRVEASPSRIDDADVTVTLTRSVAEELLSRAAFAYSDGRWQSPHNRRRTTDISKALTWALVDIAENGTCLGSTALLRRPAR
jgi:hypothetical protein